MANMKGLISKITKNSRKSILAVGLATLVATTAIKDNVHFGSVTLNNPQESHYTWGLFPTTEVVGDAKGNFYTFGLLYGKNKFGQNSEIIGNASAYGIFIGRNDFGDAAKITGNLTNKGIVTKNPVSDWGFGSDDFFGLKDYIVSTEQTDEEGGTQ